MGVISKVKGLAAQALLFGQATSFRAITARWNKQQPALLFSLLFSFGRGKENSPTGEPAKAKTEA
ncbi:MAG: hypothetical protein ACE3JN_16615 [Ectobacillus sp.]